MVEDHDALRPGYCAALVGPVPPRETWRDTRLLHFGGVQPTISIAARALRPTSPGPPW